MRAFQTVTIDFELAATPASACFRSLPTVRVIELAVSIAAGMVRQPIASSASTMARTSSPAHADVSLFSSRAMSSSVLFVVAIVRELQYFVEPPQKHLLCQQEDDDCV